MLPSRYQALKDRIVREASEQLAEAAATPRKGAAGRTAGIALMSAAVVLGGWVFSLWGDSSAVTVPFSPASVISADAAGTAARPSDFFGQAEELGPRPAPSSAPPTTRPAAARQRRRATTPRRSARAEIQSDLEELEAALEGVEEEPMVRIFTAPRDDEEGVPTPAPSPAPKLVINVGTKLPVKLRDGVTTASAPVPVAAELESDVTVGERVVLPVGTRLVGEAFATADNDRAQMVFQAAVVGGQTVPLRGLTQALDGEFGLPGKVVRKGSGKRGVLRWIGSALHTASFGLLPTDPLVGAAVDEVARGLDRQAYQWTISDKAVRVKSGTRARVFLRADMELPQ